MKLRTRSGNCHAKLRAIRPPTDGPARWMRSIPRLSSRRAWRRAWSAASTCGKRAVSYTHLDVYKRQEWNGTAGGAFANDIIFTGNQIFATKDFTLSGDLSGGKIYDMALDGWGCMRIAKKLMDDKVPLTRVKSNTECDVN